PCLQMQQSRLTNGPGERRSVTLSVHLFGMDLLVCRGSTVRPGARRYRAIELATFDLSGPYRSVFDTLLPAATQVADPFRGSGYHFY
ncbi:MAG: hypothetical protein LC749_08555, partial [Actinobacteria bacterium]|nr:hypothetical protein [Actinomycetota bacterium]